jgi:predicted restriction endonuclease
VREIADDRVEHQIQKNRKLGPTEKLDLVKSRRGQGLYRQRLEQIEDRCRVTGLLDRRYLRASHIKPWCVCDDQEKLDGYNGLLLSPHIDHLFDRGHLTFSDSGEMKVAEDMNLVVLDKWGLSLPKNVGAFQPEQCGYLEYHRTYVFEKG